MIDVIYHIDEIARQKARHVAGIFFKIDESLDIGSALNQIEELRNPLIMFLDEMCIPWDRCFDFFDGNIDPFYKGDIYIDIEIDPQEERFSKLTKILENEDETPKINGVEFRFYRYEDALSNEGYYNKSLNNV